MGYPGECDKAAMLDAVVRERECSKKSVNVKMSRTKPEVQQTPEKLSILNIPPTVDNIRLCVLHKEFYKTWENLQCPVLCEIIPRSF
jgi:hypothetical protein